MKTLQAVIVPLERLHPNPDNPASRLRGIEELAASIKAVGILQPLVITRSSDARLTIVDGQRRYTAAGRAGLTVVPCMLSGARTRAELTIVMMAAGLGERLTPLEEAHACTTLRAEGMTIMEIVAATGRSATTVRDRLLLAGLPTQVQDMVTAGTMAATAATELARQTTTTGSGTVTKRIPSRPGWFTATHPLAGEVRDRCEHREVRSMLGGVGCGQCWEATITDHARQEVHA